MAIESNAMTAVLAELECRTNFNIKKVTEYMLPALKEPFYLYIDGKSVQLVIRPAYEVFLPELVALPGVHSREKYCHYSEMTRFPKRVQKSVNGIHYGLAFGFDDADGVKGFIRKLIDINKG